MWRLYEAHTNEYDRDRSRTLMERRHLSAVVDSLSKGASILDLGCGVGEPIARFFIEHGLAVTGVDAAPSMINLCRQRFPQASWIEADMRSLDLGRRFDAIVAWDSFFHLEHEEQRAMFDVFARHIRRTATCCSHRVRGRGEAIGELYGHELFHASLDEDEYQCLLARAGFEVMHYRKEDPDCGDHTVWLAQHIG